MFSETNINYYDGELDVKTIISQANLDSLDEALNICDLSSVVQKFNTWQRCLPRIRPFYAVKCNDDPIILQTLADLGTSFDCASKNEIKQVLATGVSAERIIFANPCKPASHLQYAKAENVNLTTVDNEFEIYKIFQHYPEANLVLRFRSEAKTAQCPLGDKFGCDAVTEAAPLLLLAKSLNMNVVGVSFHVGSGCNDLPAYGRAIATARTLFDIGKLLGYDMKLLDIGGGFPGSDDGKFEMIAHIINKSLAKHFADESVEIIAEPGRFFVAAAYTLICKVHAKREVRTPAGILDTIMYYVNDGVYGSFNCILYDHQEVTAMHFLDNDEELGKFKSLIWGPTCDALDKISDNLHLPRLETGDLIGFPNMGAYTVPIASPFNGFMLPKILYFKERRI